MRLRKGIEQGFEHGVMLRYNLRRHGFNGVIFMLRYTSQIDCGTWETWPDLTNGKTTAMPDTELPEGMFPTERGIGHAWHTFGLERLIGHAIGPPIEFTGVCRRVEDKPTGWLLTNGWKRVLCLVEGQTKRFFLWDGMAQDECWHTPWGVLRPRWKKQVMENNDE